MTTVKELVIAAKAGIENLTPAEAAAEIDEGDALLLDVREPEETARGIIPSAILVPRGTLEFAADPRSRGHVPALDPGLRVIVYSSDGARSALAAAVLQQFGYRDVAHIEGGYQRWVTESWPTLAPDPRVNTVSRRPVVELVVPDDPRRAVVRVELDGEWAGDLVIGSPQERARLLSALVTGDLRVIARDLPLTDFSVADRVTEV